MSRNLPNFLIAGYPRCGTTFLYQKLKSHPDIFMPDIKEPKFFSNPDYMNQLNEYRKLFDGVTNEKCIGEATPRYIFSRNTAENIHKVLGANIKIILIFRNPIERINTLYTRKLYTGEEKRNSLEQILLKEQDKIKHDNDPFENTFYFKKSATGVYLSNYLRDPKVFNFDNFYIIKNEEMKNLDGIHKFLGVDNLNNGKSYTKREYVNKTSTSLPFGKLYTEIPGLSIFIKHIIPNKTKSYIRKRYSQKNPLTKRCKEIIIDTLRNDIELMESLTEFNLDDYKHI